MVKQILISVFLIVSTLGFSQNNFYEIDKKSKTTPDSLKTYTEIARYLTNNLETDIQKARAIYIWIAHNIKYNLAQINSDKRYCSNTEIVNEVLTQRKGVCQHYSELFLAMTKYVGVKSYLITGYTRNAYGGISDLSHAWNAVKIASKYYLVDVTWAAGYEHKGKYIHKFRDNYFFKTPKEFIKDHMPFDPIWQFVDNPISNDNFVSQDFSNLKKSGNFSYPDSINHHESISDLDRIVNANRRIKNNGEGNKLVSSQIDENILQLVNRRYNLAVDTLNSGVEAYNKYVDLKNRQFRNPKVSDYTIKNLIDNAGYGIYAANDAFYGLYSSDKELDKLIYEAKNNMPNLISDLEREKGFVNRYLKMWKPLRFFMFFTY